MLRIFETFMTSKMFFLIFFQSRRGPHLSKFLDLPTGRPKNERTIASALSRHKRGLPLLIRGSFAERWTMAELWNSSYLFEACNQVSVRFRDLERSTQVLANHDVQFSLVRKLGLTGTKSGEYTPEDGDTNWPNWEIEKSEE